MVIDPVAGSFSVMRAAHACGRRFLGGDILGAVGGIERLPRLPVELFARQTPDGWNSQGDEFDEPNLTGAILEFATGPTGPKGEALLPLQAAEVRCGQTGPQLGTGT